jgi:hypothetical protein
MFILFRCIIFFSSLFSKSCDNARTALYIYRHVVPSSRRPFEQSFLIAWIWYYKDLPRFQLNTPIGTDHFRSVFVFSPFPVGAHIGAVERLKTSVVDPNHFDNGSGSWFSLCHGSGSGFSLWYGSGSLLFQRGNVPKTVLFIHLNLIFFQVLVPIALCFLNLPTGQY